MGACTMSHSFAHTSVLLSGNGCLSNVSFLLHTSVLLSGNGFLRKSIPLHDNKESLELITWELVNSPVINMPKLQVLSFFCFLCIMVVLTNFSWPHEFYLKKKAWIESCTYGTLTKCNKNNNDVSIYIEWWQFRHIPTTTTTTTTTTDQHAHTI